MGLSRVKKIVLVCLCGFLCTALSLPQDIETRRAEARKAAIEADCIANDGRLDPGGELRVTDGPCCCWMTAWFGVWADCHDCEGWFLLPKGPYEIRFRDAMSGPEQEHGPGADWMLDHDRDGDVDLHDIAHCQLRPPVELWWVSR